MFYPIHGCRTRNRETECRDLGRTGFLIDRGLDTTTAAAHLAQAVALPLINDAHVPFLEEFFGSPASGNLDSIHLPGKCRSVVPSYFSLTLKVMAPPRPARSLLWPERLANPDGGQVTLQVPVTWRSKTAPYRLSIGATYSSAMSMPMSIRRPPNDADLAAVT